MSIVMSGPVAFLYESRSAVFFSKSNAVAFTNLAEGTALKVKEMESEMNVAFWGEDNRFPQNIEQQLAYCGIAKSGLDWKARILYGNGIVPGRITDVKDDGTEVFTPLKRQGNKAIYAFLENRQTFRFWQEFLQDWVWYGNCFPEVILSKDCKEITGLVHQESCDSRFEQMNEKGEMKHVLLSKLWGASEDQYVKFDPKKAMPRLQKNPSNPDLIDNKYIKRLHAIDMYNPLESLTEISDQLRRKTGLKSAILPVNYPSVNKTYYQLPAWDGARLAGWFEIAAKLPTMLKALYTKAFNIRYHIEIPDTFFEDKYSPELWGKMDETKRTAAKREFLQEMDDALSGSENAYKSFVSFYKIGGQDKKEYGSLKINEVPDNSKLDKEFITQSAADIQTLVAMGINPTLFGAGTIGTGQQRSGGSDIRESFLVYCAGLTLERQILMEPLYLVRDFNQWGDDITFRVRDTVLTTLDTGRGTKKVIS